MTLARAPQMTQYRLAQHYLRQLHQANAASRRGHGNRNHWLNLVQQDWEQIKHWQAWSALWKDADVERARLCATFPIDTTDILRLRQSPYEQLTWAQQALEAARRLGDEKTELTLFFQVAMLNLTIEELDRADEYARQFMERALAAEDELSIGLAWYVQGSAVFTRGSFDRAEDCFSRSLALLESCRAGDAIPQVWRGLGRIAQFRGNYQQARAHQLKFLETATAAGSEQGVLDAHVALSGISLALRDYEAAEQYAQRAVVMARAYGLSRWFPPALLSLAHAQKWQGKYESACANYEEAIAGARIVCPPSTVVNGLYGLGQAKFMQGDYAAALTHLEEALPIALKAQLPLRICEVAHDLVFVHIASNEPDAAQAQLQEALRNAILLGTPHFLTKTLAAAIMLWHYWGRHEQATVWAGLLTNYTQNLHPSLFSAAVYEQLKEALGAEHYQQALEQGKTLTLNDVISEISRSLASPNHTPQVI